MSFEAKAFVCLVVTAGFVVLGYGTAHPSSKNIAEFICYLLVVGARSVNRWKSPIRCPPILLVLVES
jgi:hypothetical protein